MASSQQSIALVSLDDEFVDVKSVTCSSKNTEVHHVFTLEMSAYMYWTMQLCSSLVTVGSFASVYTYLHRPAVGLVWSTRSTKDLDAASGKHGQHDGASLASFLTDTPE